MVSRWKTEFLQNTPSIFERKIGRVVVEGLAAKLPVIGTDSGGNPDIFEDVYNGLKNNPILVTGCRRSGTTLVGTLLSEAKNAHYVNEIFNPQMGSLADQGIFSDWFTYITTENANQYAPAIRAFLKRKQTKPDNIQGLSLLTPRLYARILKYYLRKIRYSPRLVIKDPIACFSTDWLSQTFSMDVVVIVCHPAAFVYRILKHNWLVDFDRQIISQDMLMRDHLNKYRGMLETDKKEDPIRNASLQWLITYHVLHHYARDNQNYIVIRHEDISMNPLDIFAYLFSRLSLYYDNNVHFKILEYTSASNPVEAPKRQVTNLKRNSKSVAFRWKQFLSTEQIAQVRRIVEPVSCHYYDPSEW